MEPSTISNKEAFMQYFEDVFNCNVCLSRAAEPRMCPNCSKLFCNKCINEWLEADKSEGKCPHCRKALTDKLVIIRWEEDLEKLQKIKNADFANENGNCNEHKLSFEFFCKSCAICICGKCVSGQHENHLLKTINNVFRESLAPLQEQKAVMEKRLEEISALIDKHNQEKDAFLKRKETYFSTLQELEKQEIDEIKQKYIDLKLLADESIEGFENKIEIEKNAFKTLSNDLTNLNNEIERTIEGSKYNVIVLKDELAQKFRAEMDKPIPTLMPTNEDNNSYFYDFLKISFAVENISNLPAGGDIESLTYTDSRKNLWFCYVTKDVNGLDFYVKLDNVKKPIRVRCIMSVIHDQNNSKDSLEENYLYDENDTSCGYKTFMDWQTVESYKNKDKDSLKFEVVIMSIDHPEEKIKK